MHRTLVPMLLGLLVGIDHHKLQPASVQRTRHTIQVEGHPLAMWAKVPTEPKGSIVFLHGRTWSGVPDFDVQVEGEQRSVMDAFVERGYATYALDLRGYGESPRDETGWLTPDRASKDLAAALVWVHEQSTDDGLTQRPYLFGWSMGSTVAQLCAQRNPELMAGLILFGYWKDPDQDIPHRDPPQHPERRVNTAQAAASDFIRPEIITQKAIDAYVKLSLECDPIRVDWRAIDQFNELDPALVKVPTLLVQGEHDPLAKTEAHARLFQRLGHPDRQWVIIEGGTHAAILEDTLPRVVNAVTAFMERGG
ncbi:MAG: alpha/beta fold hydrolase [Planctomycetota bacterium]|nr:alpha/beta fold hydrolase [Planctomycetota bacterium]